MRNAEYITDKSAEDIHERVRHPQTRREAKVSTGNSNRTNKNNIRKKTIGVTEKAGVERPARNRTTKRKTPPDIGGRPESYNRKRRDY